MLIATLSSLAVGFICGVVLGWTARRDWEWYRRLVGACTCADRAARPQEGR